MKTYKFSYRSEFGDKIDLICREKANNAFADYFIFHIYLYINDLYKDKLPNLLATSYSDLEEQCKTYLKFIE